MDNLEKLLKDATPRPWMVPHLACDDVTCNCRYVVAEYGGMGSIATISVAESDKYPWGDDKGPDIESAKANARLIAMAPDLAADNIRLEDENASLRAEVERLTEALSGIDVYLSDTLSGRVKPDPSTYKQWLIEGIVTARERARAALKGE